MNKKLILILAVLFSFFSAQAQIQKHWLYIAQDHSNTAQLQNQIAQCGAQILTYSRWLSAYSVKANPAQLKQLSTLPSIANIHPVASLKTNQTPHKATYNLTTFNIVNAQLGTKAFANNNLHADSIVIGVIDAGFFEANQRASTRHIFDSNRVLGIRDFLEPNRSDHYNRQITNLDDHGTSVLERIAGKIPAQTLGSAHKASFYLARTDHGSLEYRAEEDLYIAALEWMDSLGVKLVNTSLGYGLGHDDKSQDYKPEEMNGSSAIAKAVQIATEQKGMLIVVSAGNDGSNKKWQVVSTPADACGVVSVGACLADSPAKMGYSGKGPEALTCIKPEVTAFSNNGTSFSAPSITAFMACLMQAYPNKSNAELKAILLMSGNLAQSSNNYAGYGIPNAHRALAQNPAYQTDTLYYLKPIDTVWAPKKVTVTLKNGQKLTLFHKSDSRNVISQEVFGYNPTKNANNKIKIEKPENRHITQTTAVITRSTDTFLYFNTDKRTQIIWKKANKP